MCFLTWRHFKPAPICQSCLYRQRTISSFHIRFPELTETVLSYFSPLRSNSTCAEVGSFVCVCVFKCVSESRPVFELALGILYSDNVLQSVCLHTVTVCVCAYTWAPGGLLRPQAGITPASAQPAASCAPMSSIFVLLLCNSYCNMLLQVASSHYSLTLQKPCYYYCYYNFYSFKEHEQHYSFK